MMQHINNFYTLYLQTKIINDDEKKLLGLVLASIVIAGCIKGNNKCSHNDSTVIAPASEVQALKDSIFWITELLLHTSFRIFL